MLHIYKLFTFVRQIFNFAKLMFNPNTLYIICNVYSNFCASLVFLFDWLFCYVYSYIAISFKENYIESLRNSLSSQHLFKFCFDLSKESDEWKSILDLVFLANLHVFLNNLNLIYVNQICTISKYLQFINPVSIKYFFLINCLIRIGHGSKTALVFTFQINVFWIT